MALRDQLDILQHACESFDDGKAAVGKFIAVGLRTLLNQYGIQHSLLHQLGLRDGSWLTSAQPLSDRNPLSQNPFLIHQVTSEGATYLPALGNGPFGVPTRRENFPDWWTKPVIKDGKGRFLSRFDIVSNIANTDGGAHVDPDLEEVYMDFSRRNSLGWIFQSADGQRSEPGGRVELVTVRQIAYEVIETLKLRAPQFFGGHGVS